MSEAVFIVMNVYLQGIALVWESYKLDPYVQRLAEAVFNFQEKVEDLLFVEEQLDVDVRSLETCPYSANTFADILGKIQHAVDDLSLRQYSNLHIWVTRLDEEVNETSKSETLFSHTNCYSSILGITLSSQHFLFILCWISCSIDLLLILCGSEQTM
jgi:hypothetical protein